MPAGTYHIEIDQGATLTESFVWKDSAGAAVNLTGYTARSKAKAIRPNTNEIWNLTNAAGITLGGAAGTITLTLSAAATAALDFAEGRWDLELVSGSGVVTRLLEGRVTLSKEVTT